MFLKINGSKFYGNTKSECLADFMKQQFPDSKDLQIIEKVYMLADAYIQEHCATEDEIENAGWNDDIFGKYCTNEILLNAFEELIKGEPVRYRGVRFGEEEDEE